MSSPRAPRPRGAPGQAGTERTRPSPGGRRLLPAVPRRKAMPSLALRRGRDARSPGRGGAAPDTSRRPCAPGILTFYTDTATSEKVFAGAGGTWLSPDADDPGGSRAVVGVAPGWCRLVVFMGLVKVRAGLHRNSAPLLPHPPSPGVPQGSQTSALSPKLVFFILCWVSVPGGRAGEGLWWPWDRRDGGDRVVQPPRCPGRGCSALVGCHKPKHAKPRGLTAGPALWQCL